MRIFNRREFLGGIGIGGLLASTGASHLFFNARAQGQGIGYDLLDPRNPANFTNPLRLPSDRGLLGMLSPSQNLTLTTREVTRELAPGVSAKLWVYESSEAGRTYENPILRMTKGARLDATLKNELSEKTIIHWHGLNVDWKNDGHPSYEIQPGETYPYGYSVQNRSGTYWYHSHPHGHAGEQQYAGLASLFLVDDEEETELSRMLDLNLGQTDIPLILQDKQFNNGSFAYTPDDDALLSGFIGDVVLGNLTINPFMDVSTRIYRFRILNASNARTYRLAFTSGAGQAPFSVIGSDGGLLEQPYQVTEVFLAPAERIDLLLDLSRYQVGDVLFLESLPFNPMHQEHEHGVPMTKFPVPDGGQFYILKLNITRSGAFDRGIPARLSEVSAMDTTGAAKRDFIFAAPSDIGHGGALYWSISGWTFEMDRAPVSVKKDSVEIWELINTELSMPHPMHIHGFQFRVLNRKGSPEQISRLAVDSSGLLPAETGWKDTVHVWPNETVRLAVNFTHGFAGEQVYMFHCHILEHQDLGMMINYRVG
ncbi:MAG: multicopper oxidase family protein [Acidobacteria bacterium]|nr:multicopper oxidase family protein [Acidobacteriota bacterium]